MTEYANIINAIKKPLSPQQQVENYDAFKKLQDAGVTVPDLVKRLEALEDKVSKLSGPADAELFEMMESAVKDDPAVADARKRMQAEKTRAISAVCMADPGYKAACEAYKRAKKSRYSASTLPIPYQIGMV